MPHPDDRHTRPFRDCEAHAARDHCLIGEPTSRIRSGHSPRTVSTSTLGTPWLDASVLSTGRSTDTRSDWARSRRYVSSARSTSFAPWAMTHRQGSDTAATRSEGAENQDSPSAGTAVSYTLS